MLASKIRVCERERKAKREQEPENVLVSALWLFLLHVSEREREKEGEQKESAKKVYNALKPVRHSLLYIKPVNSLVNVPMVPSTLPHSLFTIEQEITEADRRLDEQTDKQTDRQSQVQPQPALTTVTFSVSHTYTHTLVCRQTLPRYSASPPLPLHHFHLLPF